MRRSREEIVSEILDVCLNGANKTRIVYQANLNFRTVNPYLDLLIEKNLIKVSQGHMLRYETTSQGIGHAGRHQRSSQRPVELGKARLKEPLAIMEKGINGQKSMDWVQLGRPAYYRNHRRLQPPVILQ